MTEKLSEVARAIRKKCAEIEHRPEYAPEAMVPDMMLYADEYATAAIEAHEKALEAEGLVIVPREPTDAMIEAGGEVLMPMIKETRSFNQRYIYKAMLAALEGKDAD